VREELFVCCCYEWCYGICMVHPFDRRQPGRLSVVCLAVGRRAETLETPSECPEIVPF
jgi:hypothetical protein